MYIYFVHKKILFKKFDVENQNITIFSFQMTKF